MSSGPRACMQRRHPPCSRCPAAIPDSKSPDWGRLLASEPCQARWFRHTILFSRATTLKQDTPVSESSIVAETAARIFADLADPQEVNRAKDGAWKEPLWRALADAGLTLAWVPEEQGGAGAELADGFAVLDVAGRYAAAVPLAETLLAGWLLSRAGLKAPQGAMSVAPARPSDRITLNADGTLSGQARGVPFAKDTKHLAVVAGSSVALVETKACRLSEGVNLAGEPQNTVTFDKVRPLAVGNPDIDQTALMLMGCVVRSVQ